MDGSAAARFFFHMAQTQASARDEALRDRSARDGDAGSLPDTFVRHRHRIETIAAKKIYIRPPAQRHSHGAEPGPRAAADVTMRLRSHRRDVL